LRFCALQHFYPTLVFGFQAQRRVACPRQSAVTGELHFLFLIRLGLYTLLPTHEVVPPPPPITYSISVRLLSSQTTWSLFSKQNKIFLPNRLTFYIASPSTSPHLLHRLTFYISNPEQHPRISYMSELGDQLERLGLFPYLDAFIAEGFDSWDIVLDITESDL
jgi:hypothetical protein